MVVLLETVVEVVGTMGEETEVAMVGMLGPWATAILVDPLLPPVPCVLGER